jgi:tetratricopeptide (TPR) repeat protein
MALREAAERERRKAEEAETQQTLAAARLQSALDVLHLLTLAMQRVDPSKIPDGKYFRNQVLKPAREFYQKLLAEKNNPDRQARRRIGQAFHGLGMIYTLLDEHAEAQAAYLQAVAWQETLVQEFPAEENYRVDLALTYHSLGEWHASLGRKEEAAASYQKIVALFESLPSDDQRVDRFAFKLAQQLWDLGKSQERSAGRIGPSTGWKRSERRGPTQSGRWPQKLCRTHTIHGHVSSGNWANVRRRSSISTARSKPGSSHLGIFGASSIVPTAWLG